MASDRVMVTRVKINRIADAIREKTETTKSYELDEMPEAIRSIKGGGSGGLYALSDVSGLLTKSENDVVITWTDPTDLLDHNGDMIAEWAGTILVKKENEIPLDINDGTQVVVNTVRNQYATSGFVDENVDLTKTYFYRFFPYTKENVYLLSTVKPCLPDTSWSTAPDQTIATLIHMADMGYIDLYDDLGWRVGDERVINLSANAGYGGMSVPAQSATFVLMNRGGYEFATPPSTGQTQCHFVVGMKEILNRNLSMGWQAGSQLYWWGTTQCREWCNNTFITSIPSTLRNIFKKVKIKTAVTDSTVDLIEDLFFVAAQKEVLGDKGSGFQKEADALFQWEYYKIAANRKKTMYSFSNAWVWYNRSLYEPRYPSYKNFCTIDKNGNANTTDYGDTATYGMSVAGCI